MKWIGIKDKLPDDNDLDVIVTDGNSYSVGYYDVRWGWIPSNLTSWNSDYEFDFTPTHWMELPEPPQE